MKRQILACALAILSAAPVRAENHLPVAPQYYLDTVIGISLAEQYVWHCPEFSVDEAAMGAAYGEVLEQLAAEGIPTDAPDDHMQLPPVEETDGIIRDMLARNEGAAYPGQAFCAEARAQMAAESLVGSFLKDTN